MSFNVCNTFLLYQVPFGTYYQMHCIYFSNKKSQEILAQEGATIKVARVPRGRYNRFSPSTTSTRIASRDPVFSSKFRKVVRAGGPWFESGQSTFGKLHKISIEFRFSYFFGPLLHLEISYGSK